MRIKVHLRRLLLPKSVISPKLAGVATKTAKETRLLSLVRAHIQKSAECQNRGGLIWLEQKIDLNADGSRQKIADRHSCAVASVEKQRIARLELTLHSVAASNGTGIAVGD
jgi:hypothetical protein